MAEPQKLFTTTLQHLFKEMSDENKIQLMIDLTQEANKQIRRIKIVYASSSSLTEDDLYFKILETLDPEWSTDLCHRRRDHPYQVMIVEKLRDKLNYTERLVAKLRLGLLETYQIIPNTNDFGEQCKIVPALVLPPPEIVLPIPLDEAEKIVDKMIDEYIIEQESRSQLKTKLT